MKKFINTSFSKPLITFIVTFFLLFIIILVTLLVRLPSVPWFNDLEFLLISETIIVLFLEIPLLILFGFRSMGQRAFMRRLFQGVTYGTVYTVSIIAFIILNMLTGNRIVGYTDCGGIDPGFDTKCNTIGSGQRRSCILFICYTHPSPSTNHGFVITPPTS